MRWLVVLLLAALSGTAAADDLTEEPEIGPSPSMGARLSDKLSLLSNEVALHLATLSADMINLHVDVAGRSARLRVGHDQADSFVLRLDGDVVFVRGTARVKATLDIGLSGRRLRLNLPDFDVVPRSFEGRRYLELRLPVVEGSF